MWGYDMEFDKSHWVLFIQLTPDLLLLIFYEIFKVSFYFEKNWLQHFVILHLFVWSRINSWPQPQGWNTSFFVKNWCDLKNPFLYFWVFCIQKCMVIMSNRTSTKIVEFTFRSSGFWIYGRAWNLTKPLSRFCLDKIQKNYRENKENERK